MIINCTIILWSAVAQQWNAAQNRVNPGPNPLAAVLKGEHFLSLHDAPVHLAV